MLAITRKLFFLFCFKKEILKVKGIVAKYRL